MTQLASNIKAIETAIYTKPCHHVVLKASTMVAPQQLTVIFMVKNLNFFWGPFLFLLLVIA